MGLNLKLGAELFILCLSNKKNEISISSIFLARLVPTVQMQ